MDIATPTPPPDGPTPMAITPKNLQPLPAPSADTPPTQSSAPPPPTPPADTPPPTTTVQDAPSRLIEDTSFS